MNSIKIPQIKPHFRVEIIEPKQVYLLEENSTHALTGSLYCQILPLLNGENSLQDIIQKLDGQVPPDHIDYVLQRLQAKGYLTEAAPDLSPEIAAFWSALGIDPPTAAQSLQQAKIALTAVGEISPEPLAASLAAVGIHTQPWETQQPTSPYTLLAVLTDDYLQPDLAKINQIALQTNQPWLLVKPVGNILWLGPIFIPQETGCCECLAHRLRGNREVETSILRQKAKLSLNQKGQTPTSPPLTKQGGLSGCLPTARATLPSTVQTALQLTTTEIAKWVVQQETATNLKGKILTFNQISLELQTHTLPHRPQCPACGNPQLLTERGFQPVTLRPLAKHFTSDGGHRSVTPDQTVQNHQHLISPITGVVTALVRVSDPNNPLVHTYSAVHSFGSATSLKGLRHALRHKSSGKGKTDRQSKASGFCEAVERYSGIFQGDEPRKQATLAELGEKAIHPYRCLHFSPRQYENREALNERNTVAHDWIPQTFDESQSIDWTPVWSLTEQTHKYLPTAYCYYDYPLPKDHRFCRADSNGNAAGNTLEEAILQGFMELIERDCVGIWWYNRLQRPAVDLASFDEPYFLELQTYYQNNGRELWVLDLTADLGIPAFAGVSRRIDGGAERIIAGYGAHLDPKIAILRAVTEVNQIGLELDKVEAEKLEGEWRDWMLNATLENQPYLAFDPNVIPKVYSDYPKLWSDDIYKDVMTCVEIAKNAGLETLVLDQTRPDIRLNVVKVIVPGLRHFWSRFGAGRLYDVPVKLGWLSAPRLEEEMNPMRMPF